VEWRRLGGKIDRNLFFHFNVWKKIFFLIFFHTTGKRLRYSRVLLLLFTFAFGEFKELAAFAPDCVHYLLGRR
jgi:hypothetical protein